MRVVLRLLATLLLLVGVPLAWVATATAEAPTQAGWWFKLNAAETPEAPAAPVPAPVPVEVTATRPPTVPEGGLLVANDPSGPAAIAAVQLFADEGASGTFTLKVADGGAGAPLVVACPAVGVWEAEEGGAWENAPKYDCEVGKVLGEVTDEAITFALDSSVAAPGGGFDVVLLPDPDSGTPFQTPFEAPADDAWAPTGGTDSSSSSGELDSASSEDFATDSEAASDAGGSASFDSGGGAVDTGGSTDFSGGDAGGAVDTGTPPAEATTPGEAPGAPFAAEQPGTEQAQPVAADDNGAERLTAIGLLVALAAGLFWISSRTGAAAGQVHAAGVGRFARPRAGRPNGLT